MEKEKPNKQTSIENQKNFNDRDENPAPGAGSALSPKEGSGAAGGGADSSNEKKRPVVLRHKTEYPRYRCAGLVLTQKPETYQVTELQLLKLRIDPWVEVVDSKEAKAE